MVGKSPQTIPCRDNELSVYRIVGRCELTANLSPEDQIWRSKNIYWDEHNKSYGVEKICCH
jgi:hypothetical protein